MSGHKPSPLLLLLFHLDLPLAAPPLLHLNLFFHLFLSFPNLIFSSSFNPCSDSLSSYFHLLLFLPNSLLLSHYFLFFWVSSSHQIISFLNPLSYPSSFSDSLSSSHPFFFLDCLSSLHLLLPNSLSSSHFSFIFFYCQIPSSSRSHPIRTLG